MNNRYLIIASLALNAIFVVVVICCAIKWLSCGSCKSERSYDKAKLEKMAAWISEDKKDVVYITLEKIQEIKKAKKSLKRERKNLTEEMIVDDSFDSELYLVSMKSMTDEIYSLGLQKIEFVTALSSQLTQEERVKLMKKLHCNKKKKCNKCERGSHKDKSSHKENK